MSENRERESEKGNCEVSVDTLHNGRRGNRQNDERGRKMETCESEREKAVCAKRDTCDYTFVTHHEIKKKSRSHKKKTSKLYERWRVDCWREE